MDELTINGKTYQIKFNHRFYNRIVDEYAKGHKDDDVDGFNNLIAGLVSEDPDAVVKAYRCACQSKSLPSIDAVGDALDDEGAFDNGHIFSEVYKEIKASGFLAMKINHLLVLLKNIWKNSEIALKVVKGKATKDEQKDVRAAETEVETNKQAYELVKKQLAELAR